MTPREVGAENIVTVEVSPSGVKVVEELSEEEAADRQRLELRVEKAFYQAGDALRSLRDRRLYRSTHRSFEEYCRDRFGMQRAHSYRLIDAASVVDNLSECLQIGDILPTTESQCRELASLNPELQQSAWIESVSRAGGKKVPLAKTIKSVVAEIKERNATPPRIPYTKSDVVEIRAGSNSTLRKHNGCWGIVTHVGTFSCLVHISLRNVNVQCKTDEMDPVDPKYTKDIRAVHQRITALSELDLDPVILSMLETLCRQTCFTQIQMNLLACTEQHYGISPSTLVG